MRIRPTAIGTNVVPILSSLKPSAIPGKAVPSPTPMRIAMKIHTVRYLFRKESLFFSGVSSLACA